MNFIGKYDSIKKYNNDNYPGDASFPDEFMEDTQKEHSYMGAQYLYLRDKLEKNNQFSNIRTQTYKNEYIIAYDYYHYILFVIYWIIFAIYVIFFIYKKKYKEYTNVIVLILMGGFPFYINLLTPILIKGLRRIIREIKAFSIILPSLKNQGDSLDSIEKKLTPNVQTPSSFKKSPDKKEKLQYKKELNNLMSRISEGDVEYDDDTKQIDVLDNNESIYYWKQNENNKWVKTMSE